MTDSACFQIPDDVPLEKLVKDLNLKGTKEKNELTGVTIFKTSEGRVVTVIVYIPEKKLSLMTISRSSEYFKECLKLKYLKEVEKSLCSP